MVEYKIDDLQRRKLLNEELNPRYEVPNEGNQKINPITGNVYLGEEDLDLRTLEEGYTSDFIEYQFTLAKMEVRDGNMEPVKWIGHKSRLGGLVKRMIDRDVPVSIISSPEALDLALTTEKKRHDEKKLNPSIGPDQNDLENLEESKI